MQGHLQVLSAYPCLALPAPGLSSSGLPLHWPVSEKIREVGGQASISADASLIHGQHSKQWLSLPYNTQAISYIVPTGARWDTQTGVIAEARLKDLTPVMPVIFIKAIPVDRMETKNIYECPVYKTRIRGPTYVWTFNLKTKEKAAKWILAAVALLLQV